MKVFAVPTISLGLGAALSVLFFIGLSSIYGDQLLGEIILVQSGVALIIVACVPQCLAYMLGGRDADDIRARFSQGVSAELAGIGLGLLVLLVALSLPFAKAWQAGALPMFLSLAVQSLGSCQAWMRLNDRWRSFMLWALFPNLVRVPLIWLTPIAIDHGLVSGLQGDRAGVVTLYFLVPDIARLLLIYVPQVARNYVRPTSSALVAGVRRILQNWLFDVGSAVTEVADKIVVGAILGPTTLVVYFFARRLGVVASMVLEPFYAEHFRRVLAIGDDQANTAARATMQRRTYASGAGFAAGLFAAMALMVGLALVVPMFAVRMPVSIPAHPLLFFSVLLIDCAVAANRWSRYVALVNGGASILFIVRLLLFGVFTGGTAWFGNDWGGLGLALALGIAWSLETIFLSAWLARPRVPVMRVR